MVVMKSLMGNDWWQATAQGGDIPIAPLPSVLFAAIIAVALPVALLPLQPPASASQSYWDDTETQRFVCSNHYCCIASCPQTLLPLNLIACPQLTSSSSQFDCNYSMLCGCRSQVIKNWDRCASDFLLSALWKTGDSHEPKGYFNFLFFAKVSSGLMLHWPSAGVERVNWEELESHRGSN